MRWAVTTSTFSSAAAFGAADLRALRDVADGFGVGSAISNADPVDFALDLVEIDGDPIAKRGKLAGVKHAYRTADGDHHVARREEPAPADSEALLEPLIRDGERVGEIDLSLEAAAERATADASLVGVGEQERQ